MSPLTEHSRPFAEVVRPFVIGATLRIARPAEQRPSSDPGDQP
jgi:hypothetical protein